MRIGHYVAVVSRRLGEGLNVSGHIQLPLHSLSLLRDAGHDVHLITHRFGADRSIPACMPQDVPIHFVDDARVRGGNFNPALGNKQGLRLGRLRRQVVQMKQIASEERLDVLHFYGNTRTITLAGLTRWCGLKCPVIVTLCGAPQQRRFLPFKFLSRRVSAVLTATAFVRDECARGGLEVQLLRHGLIRDLTTELDGETVQPRHRVLFWREASEWNGGDVCLEAFDELAPEFPDLSFDFAIRKFWQEVPGLAELERRHANFHVYRFPYPDGMSLAKLIAESLLIVLPFRRLSFQPQLAIAESLAAGVAVVSTEIESTPELITPGRTGTLVASGNAPALVEAIKTMLCERERTLEMGRQSALDLAREWNWDGYARTLESVYNRALGTYKPTA